MTGIYDYGRTYAVERLNVISSDDRSEKSLKPMLANNLRRDFSAFSLEMTCGWVVTLDQQFGNGAAGQLDVRG